MLDSIISARDTMSDRRAWRSIYSYPESSRNADTFNPGIASNPFIKDPVGCAIAGGGAASVGAHDWNNITMRRHLPTIFMVAGQ